jgi:RNA polymerase sigma-70 factor (ECF subfamily)
MNTENTTTLQEDREGGLGALMESYVDGDESAFVELHNALAPRVRRQIRRKVSDPNAAEDLLQAVFMKAHRARTSFLVSEGADADRAVAVWYSAIARNAIYDHLRKHYRARVSLLGGSSEAAREIIEAHADDAPSEEAQLLAEERRREVVNQVRGAVDRLPKSQREVVLLHRLNGLTMAEISKRLGVREGTLRVRAHRGYRALEAMLLGFKESVATA